MIIRIVYLTCFLVVLTGVSPQTLALEALDDPIPQKIQKGR